MKKLQQYIQSSLELKDLPFEFPLNLFYILSFFLQLNQGFNLTKATN